MGMRQPDIDLHIERVVLHGIAPGDRHRVGDAIGGELARLLMADGVSSALARGAEVDYIDAGTFRLPRAARPSAVGVQVARAVYRGLRQ